MDSREEEDIRQSKKIFKFLKYIKEWLYHVAKPKRLSLTNVVAPQKLTGVLKTKGKTFTLYTKKYFVLDKGYLYQYPSEDDSISSEEVTSLQNSKVTGEKRTMKLTIRFASFSQQNISLVANSYEEFDLWFRELCEHASYIMKVAAIPTKTSKRLSQPTILRKPAAVASPLIITDLTTKYNHQINSASTEVDYPISQHQPLTEQKPESSRRPLLCLPLLPVESFPLPASVENSSSNQKSLGLVLQDVAKFKIEDPKTERTSESFTPRHDSFDGNSYNSTGDRSGQSTPRTPRYPISSRLSPPRRMSPRPSAFRVPRNIQGTFQDNMEGQM
jgi:hypothetical protein